VISTPFSLSSKIFSNFCQFLHTGKPKKIALNSGLVKYKSVKLVFRLHFAFWLESARLKMAVRDGMRLAKRRCFY
jgi:hypothetical protein